MSGPSTHDEIARLAYDLWIERGRPTGSPEQDWERAERLLDLQLSHEDRSHAPAPQEVLPADAPQLADSLPLTHEVVTGKSSRVIKGSSRIRARKVPGTAREGTLP